MLGKLKGKINKLISKCMPYEIYGAMINQYAYIRTNDKKKKYAYGYLHAWKPRAKKKYYIFRYGIPSYGLFAAGLQYVFAYEWAISNGFIPVLDIESEYDFEHNRLGVSNLWDCCFEQEISVKEALGKDCVLVEAIGGTPWIGYSNFGINDDKADHYIHITKEGAWRDYYARINKICKKSWVFKAEIMNIYKECYGSKINCGATVIGVALRENFSMDIAPKLEGEAAKVAVNHPLTIGVAETIELVREYMQKWQADKIFLSTLIQESVNQFVEAFGEKVICVDRQRMTVNEQIEANKAWDMNCKERYEHTKSIGDFVNNKTICYVYEVMGLAECDYLIASKSSGSAAALALNGGKYKDIYILPDAHNIKRY